MIDHLSPREVEELAAAAAAGDALPAVIAAFTDGTRLRLGWDRAVTGTALERIACGAGTAQTGAAEPIGALLLRASRWCAAHGLHLLSFAGDAPGDEPLGETRWFMAVG